MPFLKSGGPVLKGTFGGHSESIKRSATKRVESPWRETARFCNWRAVRKKKGSGGKRLLKVRIIDQTFSAGAS